MMDQGEALRFTIWLHGYTHEEVADECAISRGHLTNVINNIDPLEMDLARGIGSLLGVVPGRLMKLDKAPLRRKRIPAEERVPKKRKRAKKKRGKSRGKTP